MNTQPSLPAIGDTTYGGIFAGCYFLNGTPYALIVSPRDEGEFDEEPWGKNEKVTGAPSPQDGLANTLAMAKAGNALAKRILALQIGDFEDWYLPSRLELFTAWLNVRDQFQATWYWTSTQSASLPGYAWYQYFLNGGQDYSHMTNDLRARAVRRLPIQSFSNSLLSEAA